MKARKSTKGFSLIELVVVMTIIGLLISFIAVNVISASQKTRDRRRKSDLSQIKAALEMYRSVNKTYPDPLYSSLCPTPSALTDGTTVYMKQIPFDPVSEECYLYSLPPPGISYTVYACLENANDPEKDATTQAGCSNASYTIIEQ